MGTTCSKGMPDAEFDENQFKEINDIATLKKELTDKTRQLHKIHANHLQAAVDVMQEAERLIMEKQKKRSSKMTKIKRQTRDEVMKLFQTFVNNALSNTSGVDTGTLKEDDTVDDMARDWLLSEFTTEDTISVQAEDAEKFSRKSTHRRASSLIINSSSLKSDLLLVGHNFDALYDWDFDVLSYDFDTALMYAGKAFQHYDLLTRFRIPAQKMSNFLDEVKAMYRDVPYHNIYHGIDVLQHVFVFLNESSLLQDARLRSLDVLGLLVAALCHDIDHPGTNNNFQINTQHELAYVYNDQSVLEHHHASTTFRIIRKTDCNIFMSLDKSDHKEARKVIIEAILATDMNHHFDMVGKCEPLFNRLSVVTSSGQGYVPPPANDDKPAKDRSINHSSVSLITGQTGSQMGIKIQSDGDDTDDLITPGVSPSPSPVKGFKKEFKPQRNPNIPQPRSESPDSENFDFEKSKSGRNLQRDSVLSADSSTGTSRRNSRLKPQMRRNSVLCQQKTFAREDVRLLLAIILHAADIHNVYKPWDLSVKWGNMINEEFLQQGDTEKSLNLPISPFMSRTDQHPTARTINFIDFIVAPVNRAITLYFPTVGYGAQQLILNRERLKQMHLQEIDDDVNKEPQKKIDEKKNVEISATRFHDTFIVAMKEGNVLTENLELTDRELLRAIMNQRESRGITMSSVGSADVTLENGKGSAGFNTPSTDGVIKESGARGIMGRLKRASSKEKPHDRDSVNNTESNRNSGGFGNSLISGIKGLKGSFKGAFQTRNRPISVISEEIDGKPHLTNH